MYYVYNNTYDIYIIYMICILYIYIPHPMVSLAIANGDT